MVQKSGVRKRYRVTRWDVTKNIHFIPLKQLVLTNSIVNAVKQNNDRFPLRTPLSGFRKNQNDTSFGLNRLDQMQEAFEKNIMLEPIDVKIRTNGTNYDIVNGRHRFVMSLLFGYELIPVIIIE